MSDKMTRNHLTTPVSSRPLSHAAITRINSATSIYFEVLLHYAPQSKFSYTNPEPNPDAPVAQKSRSFRCAKSKHTCSHRHSPRPTAVVRTAAEKTVSPPRPLCSAEHHQHEPECGVSVVAVVVSIFADFPSVAALEDRPCDSACSHSSNVTCRDLSTGVCCACHRSTEHSPKCDSD